MKAIVLSCDKYVKMTEHMIETYKDKWPNNPFIFYVPYNESYPYHLKQKFGDKIKLIKSDSEIKPTIFKLIEDIDDDEEMLYWCIDDKYLLNINLNKINKILNFLESKPENIDGLGLTFRNICISNKVIYIDGMKFFNRINYKKIWLHQFLKKKIIKHLFENMPGDLRQAKNMDYHIRDKIKFPFKKTTYVCSESLMNFGESTRRGIITKECKKSMEKYNIEIPVNPRKIK